MTKKLFAVALAIMMVFGMIACSNNTPADTQSTQSGQDSTQDTGTKATDPPEDITLEWYYRGNGIQKDTEAVNEHVNELLHQIEGFEHISVHLNPYLASDYATSVKLAQSSGDQMDILSTVGLTLADEVNNGTFVALRDYLDTDEFSALKNELPEWLWNAVTYDGSPYIVPSYQRGGAKMDLEFPVKYMEGLEDEVKAFEAKVDANTVTVADLQTLMNHIAANAQKIEGVSTKYAGNAVGVFTSTNGILFYEGISGYGVNDGFAVRESSTKAENIWLSEEVKEGFKASAEAYAAGYIDPNILLRDPGLALKDCMTTAESKVVDTSNGFGPQEYQIAKTTASNGFDTYVIPLRNSYFMVSNWAAGGNGVTQSSKHPEEALKFLQLINTEAGEEVYNTIVYGLEGIHYTKNDDGTITTLQYDGSQSNENDYSAHKWIMGNTFHCWRNQSYVEGDDEMALAINDDPNNVQSPVMGFHYDSSNVSTQIEQVTAVLNEYRDTLINGVLGENWEATYDEFVSKMKVAGVDEVIADMNAQLDEFFANK